MKYTIIFRAEDHIQPDSGKEILRQYMSQCDSRDQLTEMASNWQSRGWSWVGKSIVRWEHLIRIDINE